MQQPPRIFLSASIPVPERGKRFHAVSDSFAARSAIRALVSVVVPQAQLVWGGHPAVTPLVRIAMSRMPSEVRHNISIYQSNYFRGYFPSDTFYLGKMKEVPALHGRDASLAEMRNTMLKENAFVAGVFIGGMEGVLEEYRLFRETHPQAPVLAVANTGAAARIIYHRHRPRGDERLGSSYAYASLFRQLLNDYMHSGQIMNAQ